MTGYTPAERYLGNLARRSFLSLWSYTNVFRDEFDSKSGSREGKEVCDLVVVFGRHVLIFSDKDCEFKQTGDLQVSWRRWYKRAIESSAKQIYGAERWITNFPTRLFLDSKCEEKFPIGLPDPSELIFHRIAVVHSIAVHCIDHFGSGSGSLIFNSDIKDSGHTSQNCLPFHVGIVDSSKGYIHVLDDTTLDIILGELDTLSDFVSYLGKKEDLVKNMAIIAAGEEELLANYLSNMNKNGEHDFDFGGNYNGVSVMEGFWDSYLRNPQTIRKKLADRESYAWDKLIEEFAKHAIHGTQYYSTHPGIEGTEMSLRMMAQFSRFERRMLASKFLDFVSTQSGKDKVARVVMPTTKPGTAFIFLILTDRMAKTYDDYRKVRRAMLEVYCLGLKLRFPDLMDIVGIAIDSDRGRGGSEDLLYLDARNWDNSSDSQIIEDMKALDIFQSD